jgi:hypothetical protein
MFSFRMAIVIAAFGLAACAPAAWNNQAATGFDGFVDRISRACSPLQFGMYQFASPNAADTGGSYYDTWLDLTSRLYYGQIGPDGYAESLQATFGNGNQGTIDCTLRYLRPGTT